MKIIQQGKYKIDITEQNINITNYKLSEYILKQSLGNFSILFNTITTGCVIINDNDNDIENNIKYLIENLFYIKKNENSFKIAERFRNYRVNREKHSLIENINTFTIATTTKCNANCWYCTENIKNKFNMTPDIANDVANFIINEYKTCKDKIKLRWFGGEPLLNEEIINIITNKLKENNVDFYSIILTNGYLFDINKPTIYKNIWNTKYVQITLDGADNYYNSIKNYIYTNDTNPFNTVINNIEMLLRNNIKVSIRLNVSLDNVDELKSVINILHEKFNNYKTLYIYCIGLFQLMKNNSKDIFENVTEIEQYIYNKFKKNNYALPKLAISPCIANTGKSIVINPFGKFALCDYNIDGDTIGDVNNGITKYEDIKLYKNYLYIEQLCDSCILYPMCKRLESCVAFNYCNEFVIKYETNKILTKLNAILNKYVNEQNKKEEQ